MSKDGPKESGSGAAKYKVESEIVIRAVDKPFDRREVLGVFESKEEAYEYVMAYLCDTRRLHTYFSRTQICSMEEVDHCIAEKQMVALNVVLGQFEDSIYISKVAA